jgi:hypothetical protein
MRWVWLALAGCGDGVIEAPWCADEAPEVAADGEARTYWRDARPIFDRWCADCHVAGGSAPFSLDEPAVAAVWADLVAESVASRRMPPFLAAPCCRDYHRQATLTEGEIATLKAWAAQGAPEGEVADAPGPREPRTDLERVDVELRVEPGYTPREGEDDNRCFVLDWPLEGDRFITGIAPRPDRRDLVHHLIVAAIGPEGVAGAEVLDEADPAPGFDCGGGLGALSGVQVLGGSLVGGTFPRGIGAPIAGGSKILLQVHYWSDGAVGPDQTGVAFQVEDTAEETQTIVVTNPAWPVGKGMLVRAGEADRGYGYAMRATLFTGGKPALLQGVTPHMHRYARAARVLVLRADGSAECLLEIPDWDFGWEQPYWFAEPVRLEPRDQVYIECRFDNSQGNQPNGREPRDIAWGEQDQDMCAAFVSFTEAP